MKTYRILSLIIAAALVLSACNLPSAKPTEQANPNAVFTAAAETVVAQLTQGALLNPASAPASIAPPTGTPSVPTNTPPPLIAPTNTSGPVVIPTTACDAAQFITDVSIPDGTVFSGGATFTKTWRLKNIGTCTWNSSYALVYDSGTSLGGASSVPLSGAVAPGGSIDVSINLQAPSGDGTYRGFWGLTNASGARIPVMGGASGRSFYVEIKVGSGTASGSTPDSGGGKFAVTSVSFSVSRSGGCGASGKYVVTATITTNGPGNVTYYWLYSDSGKTDTVAHDPLEYSAASSKTITNEWVTSATGAWMGIRIDKPNHQDFKQANLNCP
jgi:hypothetical protein